MKTKLTGLFALMLLFISGCNQTTKIDDMLRTPGNYLDKECVVEGNVTGTLDIPFVKYDFFNLHDGSNEIWIYTNQGVPAKNSKVRVTGLFKKLLDLNIPGVNITGNYYIELSQMKNL